MKIRLTKCEKQSGLTRVDHAEGLILQLPCGHDGRASWLMNYGTGPEAKTLRIKRGLRFDEKTRACETKSTVIHSMPAER